jgi:hypothetical protein
MINPSIDEINAMSKADAQEWVFDNAMELDQLTDEQFEAILDVSNP